MRKDGIRKWQTEYRALGLGSLQITQRGGRGEFSLHWVFRLYSVDLENQWCKKNVNRLSCLIRNGIG